MYMPLDWSYSSVTAYRNGNASEGRAPLPAVKWYVEPCHGQFGEQDKATFRRIYDLNQDSFLVESLFAVLNPDAPINASRGEVCLSFMLQPQEDPCREDISDATTPWQTDKFKVATYASVSACPYRPQFRHIFDGFGTTYPLRYPSAMLLTGGLVRLPRLPGNGCRWFALKTRVGTACRYPTYSADWR